MASDTKFKVLGQRQMQRSLIVTLLFLAGVLYVVLHPRNSMKSDNARDENDDVNNPILSTTGKTHEPQPVEVKEHLTRETDGRTHTVVTFLMSNTMATAWKKSSERLTFPTMMSVDVPGAVLQEQSAKSPAKATLYGKSSLKIKYTKRRSLHVQFERPFRLDADSPLIKNVVLLSLWEDKYRLAYRSSVELLRQLGIFHSQARLVELRCEALPSSVPSSDGNDCEGGASLGTYLLLEYPSDAISRVAHVEASSPTQRICENAASFTLRKEAMGVIVKENSGDVSAIPLEVGTRNWFYFERPKKYDILHVPSYKRNSSFSASYQQLEKDPMGWSIEQRGASSRVQQSFDLDAYLTWIAINSVLMNGDYDDEVFFYLTGGDGKAHTGFLSVMAWDYDTVFAKCHRKEAVPSRTMYCAETPIEQRISEDPRLQQRYRDVLSCVLQRVATPEQWGTIVQNSLKELEAIMQSSEASAKATFDDSRHPPDPREGAAMLAMRLKERVGELLATLPASEGVKPRGAESHQGQQEDDRVVGVSNGASKQCELSTVKRKYASQLKKSVPGEHKAGRGVVDISGLPRGTTVTITYPIAQGTGSAHVETVRGPALSLNEAGLYCANISIPCGTTTSTWLQPFVLRSKERGSAEFALAHFTKPRPMQLVASLSTSGVKDMTLVAAVPQRWLLDQWFPVVLRTTSADGSRWVRRNVPMQLVEGGGEGETLLVRGFSAVRISGSNALSDDTDGPVLITTSSDAQLHVRVGGASGPSATISRPTPVDLSGVEPIPSFEGIERLMGDQCIVMLEDVTTIERGQSVTIGAGCVVVLKVGATLNVFGKLSIEGTASQPVTITSSAGGDENPWVSIVVSGTGASLHVAHAFVTGSGVKGRLTPNTGKHHKHSATITVIDHATAFVDYTYFIGLYGPAIASGTRGSVRVSHSVVQWAELGIECVDCDFQTKESTWSHFPSWSASYEDDDNDGMYLSGGVHRIEDSVVAHTKDDCVDSGTPEKSSGDGGSLLISNTILEMCQHEAIALSSSPKGKRHVRLSRLWIEHAQQGIESGYTGRQHNADLNEIYIASTTVALRYGDNYYNRPQLGEVTAKGLFLEKNVANVVNYVRATGGPQTTSGALSLDAQSSIFEEDATSRAIRQTAAAFSCPGIFIQSVEPVDAGKAAVRRKALLDAAEHVTWTE
ncbi:Hypothetical protein, putative [Bodo saltans]|uniref:Uncharacterized protein n=1 Tax=Bodo saltans TaxID=75058 RepID=A0A0S4KK76_BODSA|nr:Hypothetical protein, putative [Bodo saltans]|eukprot:CUI14843.1 Hypothetical protein, putative [Bodo saltans]